ncbi:MAG: methylated-DNA--[protein]-cysteine S-methyltransferase [Pseudomonadota bacterium]|nr:methylated-DNA--[protein]-cysteine S-methyltransferase [Pseudomonadota bacterium]
MNDVQSYIFKTKWGFVGLAWDFSGVRQITLPDPTFETCRKRLVSNYLHRTFKKVPKKIQSLSTLVKRYFAGEKIRFSREIDFNWQGLTPLQIKVLTKAFEIPYGKTLTYSELAEKSGFPGAARFVGNTLGKNPFLLLVPCHRIIAKNKSLGGFSAPQGKKMKQKMLQLEHCNLYG